MNLIAASALACTLLGAFVLFISHSSVYRTASHTIAGYPRVLDRLRVQRHDARLGLVLIGCGVALQALVGLGFSAPLSMWRYPTFAALLGMLPYAVWRLTAARMRPTAARKGPRKVGMRVYETRRSARLRQAALAQAPALHALEQRLVSLTQPQRLAA